jgi:hypothetical protein
MNAPHVPSPSAWMARRSFLKGAGVTLALPFLECMTPVFSRTAAPPHPHRMLLISNNLGVLPKLFFPAGSGPDYEPSPYLRELAEHRRDFTVFSGLSHPGVSGGHSTENCFLTAARGPTKSGFRNQISLDQFAAETIGQVTRFASLNLGVNIDRANRSLSWTRDGVLLPAEESALVIFRKMFLQGDKSQTDRQMHRLEERGSILDTLLEQTQRFSRSLAQGDRDRLEQYFNSVREVEQSLAKAKDWETTPKPGATRDEPPELKDKKLFFEKFELLLSMAQLAFESDSTRIVTLMVDAFATPVFQLHENQNTTDGYHNLSHHGQAEQKVKQLEDADHQQMRLLNRLLASLASKQEEGARLLDRTMVLYGSNMGDANTHDNTNLPVLLAGGGFKHGRHLAFNRQANAPLSNLFVSMLQRFGAEAESFGSSTGRLAGFEAA